MGELNGIVDFSGGNNWWDATTDANTGGSYDLMSIMNTAYPEFASAPMDLKIQMVQDIKQLPPEQQAAAIQVINTKVEETTKPPEAAPEKAASTTEQTVNAAFDQYLFRKPTAAELTEWSAKVEAGENIGMQLKQLPEAAAATGATPTYGADIQGTKLPSVFDPTTVKTPDLPTLLTYGDKVGGADPLKYGNDINGMSPVEYGETTGGVSNALTGDTVGGISNVQFGDEVAGLTLKKYGDLAGGRAPVTYGDEIAGKRNVTYGDELLGQKPLVYGEDIDGRTLARYGDKIAGNEQANYDEIVTDPLKDWTYTETEGYKAKNTLAQTELQNRMAARGNLRSMGAASAGADLTRKLFAEDYDQERALFLKNAIARYTAKGADYKAAYIAATDEYNSLYGKRTDAYNKAYTNLYDEYNKAYTNVSDEYNKALVNDQTLYETGINDRQGQYDTALTNQQGQYTKAYDDSTQAYDTAYGKGQTEYMAGLTGANSNAATTYGLKASQYDNVLNNLRAQQQNLQDRYDKLYSAQTSEGNRTYNQILDITNQGQSATGATTAAGNTLTNQVNQATGNAAGAASGAAGTKGAVDGSLWGGLSTFIPQTLQNYQSYSTMFDTPKAKVDPNVTTMSAPSTTWMAPDGSTTSKSGSGKSAYERRKTLYGGSSAFTG